MEQYAGNDDSDCCSACSAFSHEAKVGQQQADLEAENACDVAGKQSVRAGNARLRFNLQWRTHVLDLKSSALLSQFRTWAYQSKIVDVLVWHILEMLQAQAPFRFYHSELGRSLYLNSGSSRTIDTTAKPQAAIY